MATYSNLPDHQLLGLLTESDHSAYTEIYRRYFYLIFTHAYKKLRDEEQAKDIVQEVFTALWFKRESNLPSSNLGGYLYSAVRYKIFDFFSHQEVETRYTNSFKAYISTPNSAPADHLIREKQLQAYIEKQIQALPPKMKQIFLLSRMENLSHSEIARQLDISENNVSKQVNNALRILRTKLGVLLYLYFLMKF